MKCHSKHQESPGATVQNLVIGWPGTQDLFFPVLTITSTFIEQPGSKNGTDYLCILLSNMQHIKQQIFIKWVNYMAWHHFSAGVKDGQQLFFNKAGTVTSPPPPHIATMKPHLTGILLSIYHMNIFWASAEVGGESHTKWILNLRYVKNQFLINITFHILQKKRIKFH